MLLQFFKDRVLDVFKSYFARSERPVALPTYFSCSQQPVGLTYIDSTA